MSTDPVGTFITESMGKAASPCLSVPEVGTAPVGQAGPSCFPQLPAESLGLTPAGTENRAEDLQVTASSGRGSSEVPVLLLVPFGRGPCCPSRMCACHAAGRLCLC